MYEVFLPSFKPVPRPSPCTILQLALSYFEDEMDPDLYREYGRLSTSRNFAFGSERAHRAALVRQTRKHETLNIKEKSIGYVLVNAMHALVGQVDQSNPANQRILAHRLIYSSIPTSTPRKLHSNACRKQSPSPSLCPLFSRKQWKSVLIFCHQNSLHSCYA